jgi:N-acetylglutamate synthase-like GNAT family acetyltransferase
MPVTLRDAEVDDAEQLASLVAQLGYPVSAEPIKKRIMRLTQSSVDRIVVAERDGTIVGLAGLHVSHTIEYDQPAGRRFAKQLA